MSRTADEVKDFAPDNTMPHDIDKGFKAGFFDYLTKPIKINELMDVLNSALGATKSE